MFLISKVEGLLTQEVNQSIGEEGLCENMKDVFKSKGVPSPRINALKPVFSEAQKPSRRDFVVSVTPGAAQRP